jgi:hypothetical protein
MTISRSNMIENCLYGLREARSKNADPSIHIQGYVIFIPSLPQREFSKSEVRALKEHGWYFTKDYNMTFNTVG